MQAIRKSKLAKALVILTALGVMTANVSMANALTTTKTKTITCYKGTSVKKVKAIAPKCPKGWTTKKPVVKPSAAPTKPTATPTKSTATPTKPDVASPIAFNGTYKGKIALIWSDMDVRATSVTGSGTGTIAGLDELNGSGAAAPLSQCDAFEGSGVLSGGGNTLKVTFDSTAKACVSHRACVGRRIASILMVPSTRLLAVPVRLPLLSKASERNISNASCTSTPKCSAIIPLACSTVMRLSRACFKRPLRLSAC